MNYYCIYLFSMFFQTNEKTKEFQQNKNIQKKPYKFSKTPPQKSYKVSDDPC